ncbi:MAG: cryptochrome/photolyase family protein [Pseudomonadota bacterium]
MRNLVIVLGDQLNADSAALDGFDPGLDRVWIAEVVEESTHVWSHKARIVLFLSAMRHFAEALRQRGWPLEYHVLDEQAPASLAELLRLSLHQAQFERVVMVEAGDWRVQQSLQAACEAAAMPLQIRPDRHFIADGETFARWVQGRKVLRMEHWYRLMRKQSGLLMQGAQPCGGQWNFDADNRSAFDARGPGFLPEPLRFEPDAVTRAVMSLVEERFVDHPGALQDFDWPVNAAQAEQALEDFITHRLANFGHYQDAMWTRETWLYHSRLSAALNLKLLDPLHVCRAAEAAYVRGAAPIEAVEGFIRQILGWREYVRGLYRLWMPEWLEWNALEARQPLPAFFWTGETDMACLREVIGQTLQTGYAHHIQRLMVTGLFCLLLGVEPRQVHAWYLAVYVDAVEWVELPNTLGMSQYADGGRMASKPYIASGKYIQRMSNYCATCRFRPEQAAGTQACPFTTLYWDFLRRHQDLLMRNPRMGQQVRNLLHKGASERAEIESRAEFLRQHFQA